MKRKIIQIAVSSEGENTPSAIVALCDDGSVWTRAAGEWNEVAALPQPEEADEPAPKDVAPPMGYEFIPPGTIMAHGDLGLLLGGGWGSIWNHNVGLPVIEPNIFIRPIK